MRLTDYLELLRRRRGLVVLIMLGTTVAALALAYYKQPLYRATARLRVRPVAPASDLGVFLQNALRFQTSVQTEGELLRSSPVAEGVLRTVSGAGTEPRDVLKDLEVIPLPNTDVLIVSITWSDPAMARDLANAFVDNYIDVRRKQAAQEAESALAFIADLVKASEARLDSIDATLRGMVPEDPGLAEVVADRDSAVAQLGVRRTQQQALLERSSLALGVADVIERAALPLETGEDLPRNGVLGFLIGIPLALGAVLLLDSSDMTVKTRGEARVHTKADVIGVIPRDPSWRSGRKARLVTATEPLAPASEAYRMAAVNLAPQLNGLRRILVTSPGEGEGKTATAANLAISFMEAGYRVALVSMDFRRPRLHAFFNSPQAPGTSDVVTGAASLEEALIEPTKQLAILTSGGLPKHPHRIVRDAVTNGLFAEMLDRNGAGTPPTGSRPNGSRAKKVPAAEGDRTVVVIDAPATLEGAEVSSIAGHVDGVLLVVRANKTTRSAAAQAADQIRRSGGNLVGTLLVDVPKAKGGAESRPEA